ncbi:TonB-dependent receptor plug domain-containing protein [Enterovirga rhinocerotis]|uniref:Vitamin B12 transporter n=1 Tax=Enterovirga rhinocerotis TaxID=1339210 RepID=A0A4R7BP00_9HYPH|nr:TonB-dependent receptor [Enterovirga rhinocerotis]TDR87270.1 vitamin B12 transporter [Enterovirga rhinocerotis]
MSRFQAVSALSSFVCLAALTAPVSAQPAVQLPDIVVEPTQSARSQARPTRTVPAAARAGTSRGRAPSAASPSGTVRPASAAPEVVVTPNRQPEPLARQGSAISVVTREEIENSNPTSLVDALRGVPGLDITENGGPGATTSVRLRGANPGQTLVLIDGIKVNDSIPASGDFDFSTLLPSSIDRIEVLRGPQSALYGSDAIGGVINILTKSGGGEPRFSFRQEAGSYGTVNTSATATGSFGPWSYAFSGGGQKSAGFSRYGYRIRQLERRFGAFEPDGFARWGGYGKLGYDAGEGVKLEIGVMSVKTHAELDAASSTLPSLISPLPSRRIWPDTPGEVERLFSQVFARGTLERGPLTHTLTLYANQTERTFDETSYRAGIGPVSPTRTITDFRSERVGAEYQGQARLDAFGSLTFGGKYETDKGRSYSTPILPVSRTKTGTLSADQTTRSLFALWQLPIGERIVLTAGGRHDSVGREEFNTWRATGAYLIPETGTKLRASGGTGGKAPTLYQLFSPQYGTAGLAPETSIGWDAGIDQSLFGGRASVSATVFGNRFSDLIEFDSVTMRYRNVARATTSGVEVEGRVTLLPGLVSLSGAYTYLHAKNDETGLTLQRRPDHTARISLALTPIENLLIEPRVTMVSRRFSDSAEKQRLPRYARLDVYGEYKIDETWKVFARVENVTATRYQDILNYGTTGRAAYGGFSATW